MKVAIIGYGVEGQSSFAFFAAQGHEVVVHDENADLKLPDSVRSVLGASYLDNLEGYDQIIRSPGVPPSLILGKNPGVKDKITSQLNQFLSVSPTKNLIAVTGTKGKGTTSSLITKMLEATGKSVFLAGNIGVPLLSLIDKLTPESYVVMELSSFQLIDLKEASPHIAVCLMVVPEHLNWHADMIEYTEAKSQLFKHQSVSDIAIYLSGNELSKEIAEASPGQKLPYFSPPGAYVENETIKINDQAIIPISEIKLLGKHNLENICAAITAFWQVSQDMAAIAGVVREFSGLEHRLELIREMNGVTYYDDSFGTTPETAIVAIEAFNQPKVVILGGSDKGADFTNLAEVIKNDGQTKALIMGQTKEKITEALGRVGFSNYEMTSSTAIADIVTRASQLAQEFNQPAVVLLSPACASFDMFKDYKDRGEQFKQAVLKLLAAG